MNKNCIFATPFEPMKYKEPVLELEEIGYNIFDKPFEYMKYQEKEIILNDFN